MAKQTRLEAFSELLTNEILERWDPSAQDRSGAIACAERMIREFVLPIDERIWRSDAAEYLDETAP